jgi:hypothetical protein
MLPFSVRWTLIRNAPRRIEPRARSLLASSAMSSSAADLRIDRRDRAVVSVRPVDPARTIETAGACCRRAAIPRAAIGAFNQPGVTDRRRRNFQAARQTLTRASGGGGAV